MYKIEKINITYTRERMSKSIEKKRRKGWLKNDIEKIHELPIEVNVKYGYYNFQINEYFVLRLNTSVRLRIEEDGDPIPEKIREFFHCKPNDIITTYISLAKNGIANGRTILTTGLGDEIISLFPEDDIWKYLTTLFSSQ